MSPLELLRLWYLDGRKMEVWSGRSRRRLRLATQVISQVLASNLPRSCTHVRGHGGVKGALRQIQRRMPQAKFSDRNAEIADWLLRLTAWQRDWGFGLCFVYLRNVKGFGWNHKLVYRVCLELAFNMQIEPKNRLVRQKPAVLAVRQAINQTWLLSRLLLGLPRRQALFALMKITNQQASGLPDSSIDPQPSIDLTGAPFVRLVRSRSTCPVP